MATNEDLKKISVDDKLYEWAAERNLSPTTRSAVYISTPMTTGPLYVTWMLKKGKYLQKDSQEYQRSFRSDVILPNVQRAASIIEVLRWHHTGLISNPTGLEVPNWSQSDYHSFWTTVLSQYAQRAIFLNGWEFSRGCTLEFEIAQRYGIDCIDEKMQPITLRKGLDLISGAIEQIKDVGGYPEDLEDIRNKLINRGTVTVLNERKLFKDEVLDHLACTMNVAQFVSFEPGSNLRQRYCRIIGHEPNYKFRSTEEAIRALLENSPAKKVNIRSYRPESPEGNPFIKGLSSPEKIVSELKKLSEDHELFTIVNEVIDESDGGVSGVCHRGAMEFAPDTNPRCVEDNEIESAIFPFEIGMKVLNSVYGFEPDLRGREGARIEFSIHPKPQGWNQRHTIIWQSEQRPGKRIETTVRWPNRFSRMLGDKAFGLIVASVAGFPVPRTTVFSRRLFPFIFGQLTGSPQVITRTCPEEKEPGYYPTARGWYDPYAILDGKILSPKKRNWGSPPPPLSSVLIQQVIPAVYSGRACFTKSNEIIVKGVSGEGDAFMAAEQEDENIPERVNQHVMELARKLKSLVGPSNIEWVYDGKIVWIVQLGNAGNQFQNYGEEINIDWVQYYFNKNMLEDFRKKVNELKHTKKGINVIGKVSPLSHLGEIADINGVPIKFTYPS